MAEEEREVRSRAEESGKATDGRREREREGLIPLLKQPPGRPRLNYLIGEEEEGREKERKITDPITGDAKKGW